MLTRTPVHLRVHTRWRQLLHPLPRRSRVAEWWKRDKTDANEALLRRPYYTLKPIDASLDAEREKLVMPSMPGPQHADLGMEDVTHALTPNYATTFDAMAPHGRLR
eukprot:PhM_4_TR17975/c0_g1_i1/m.20408